MPSVFSMRSIMSATTAWYSEACSWVSEQTTSISILAGRSVMIEVSVFSRRSTNGWVRDLSRLAASALPWRSMGVAKCSLNDLG